MKNKNTLQKNSEKVTESIQPAPAILAAAPVIEAKQAAQVSTTVSAASVMTSAASVDTATNSTGNTARSASAAMPKPTFRAMDNAGDANDYVGTIRNGSFTNDNTPTMSGKSSPGAIITIYDNGVEIARVMAKSSGTWSYTPTLSEGRHKLSITATDKSGAVSGHSDVLIFNIQLDETKIAIEPPSFEILDHESEEIVSGISTTSTRPQIMGYEQVPGHIINVYNNKQLLGTATVEEDGSWLYIPNPALEDGEYSLTFSAAYGSVESEQTQPVVFTVDSNMNEPVDELVTDPVTEPVVEPVTEPVVEPVTEPVVEPVTEPVVEPVTEPVVEPVTEPVVEPVTEPVVEPVTEPVVEPVTEPVVEPVTEPVVEPVTEPFVGPIQISKPVVSVNSAHVTNGGHGVAFSVTTSEPGQLEVVLRDENGKTMFMNYVQVGSGTFYHALGYGNIPAGNYTYEIAIRNSKFQWSEVASGTYSSIPPAEPTFEINDDFGISQGVVENGQTDDRRPTLSGTANPAHTVNILDKGNIIGAVKPDANGNWTFTPPGDMTFGEHSLSVAVIAPIGSFSYSKPLSLTIIAPEAATETVVVTPETPPLLSFTPVITMVSDAEGKEISSNWPGLRKPPKVYEGTGKPGGEVYIKVIKQSTVIEHLRTTVGEDGTWRVESNGEGYPQGSSYFIEATIDASRIFSVNGKTYGFSLDSNLPEMLPEPAPTAPPMLIVESAFVSQKKAVMFLSQRYNGTVTLKIYDADGVLVHNRQESRYEERRVELPNDLPSGTYRYEITNTDQYGRTSEPATGPLVVDTIAPWMNLVGMSTDHQTIIGYGEPLATIKVTVNSGKGGSHTYTTKVDADGKWLVELPEALVPGRYNLEARAYDAVGNVSPNSNCYTGLQVSTPSGGVETPSGASATLTHFNGMELTPGPMIPAGNGNFIQQLLTPNGTVAGVTFPQGNMGSLTLVVDDPNGGDITPPDAPSFYMATDSMMIIGTAEPNSWITFIDKSHPNGPQTYKAQADAEGNWQVNPRPGAGGHSYVSYAAYATDAAGNNSATTNLQGTREFGKPQLTVEAVDNQGLALQTAPHYDADLCISGTIKHVQAQMAASAPTLQGTTQANGIVTIKLYRWKGTLDTYAPQYESHDSLSVFYIQALTTTADANGNWHLTLPDLPEGDYQYKVGTYGANGAYTSQAHMLVIEREYNPEAITIEAPPEKFNGTDDLSIRGTATANAAVNVFIHVQSPVDGRGPGKTFTVTADAQGNWKLELDRSLWDGLDTTTMRAVATTTDSNGQVSTTQNVFALVDLTPPPPPNVTVFQDFETGVFYIGDQGGKLLRNSVVNVEITDESGRVQHISTTMDYLLGVSIGGLFADMPLATDEMAWSIRLPLNLVGDYTIVATVTDPFGNVSQPTTYSSATDGAAKMAAIEVSDSVVTDDAALVADAVESVVVAEAAVEVTVKATAETIAEAAANTAVEATEEATVEAIEEAAVAATVETAEVAPLMLEDVLAAPVDLGLDSQAQALFEAPAAPAVSAEPVVTSYTMAMPTVNDLLAQQEMMV